jgi:hypothetical protein
MMNSEWTAVEVRQDSDTSHHAGSHHLAGDANARHPHGDDEKSVEQLVADQAYGQPFQFEMVIG